MPHSSLDGLNYSEMGEKEKLFKVESPIITFSNGWDGSPLKTRSIPKTHKISTKIRIKKK